MTNDAPTTPTTPEELVDSAWDRLAAIDGSTVHRMISRHQLAEFMAEAAFLAMDASGMDGPVESRGPVRALLQSLKVLAEATANDHSGWAAIARRAHGFTDRVTKDVTRFLEQPGLFVKHPTVELDLSVASVSVGDDGRIMCACVVPGDDTRQWQFDLAALYAAGPLDDAMRIMVGGIAKAMTDDIVARLVSEGRLQREDDALTIHHLEAHPEYVMEGNGPGTTPAEDEPPLCGV